MIEQSIISNNLFFFWKGRVALYAILKSIGISKVDEVVIQGFTCVVVANAIIYLGAKPVYIDIDPKTYNATPKTYEGAINSRTKAIIVQNTFGFSPELDPIMAMAREKGIIVIEDCAHGLGGRYNGKPNGTIADASFFSTQWSKPITTGLGGIAFSQIPEISKGISQIHSSAIEPSFNEVFMLNAQIFAFKHLLKPYIYWPMVETYRWLTQKMGLNVGSSSNEELNGTQMPDGFLKKMSQIQISMLKKEFGSLEEKVKRRREAAGYYDEVLKKLGVETPHRPSYAEHSFLRYPIRVKNKNKSLELARKYRLPIGDWFLSPLHPVMSGLDRWNYVSGSCPNAEEASRTVINLPIDNAISEEQIKSILTR